MVDVIRHTIVVNGRLAMQERRLEAARRHQHGLQAMTFEQLAARLAGGFSQPIDGVSLRNALQVVLPATPMGELERIKNLPGMVTAAGETLKKVWLAGIELATLGSTHPRLAAIAELEAAVMAELPPGMMRPVDLVAAAAKRINHAPAILGSVEIIGFTELSPCWRPLLKLLGEHLPVSWTAGPRKLPAWLAEMGISINSSDPLAPVVEVVSAATAYHEAVEAMRWARDLLASGKARAWEIGIAATSPADYDDYFLALRADANLDLHFVHGVSVVTTRDGQAAAALADIVKRGLSQSRVRRLAALCKDTEAFSSLPDGWMRIMPTDAPLSSVEAWARLFNGLTADDWPDGKDHTPELRKVINLLAGGLEATGEIGSKLLTGQALSIWRKALEAGPSASIDATLEALKQDDGLQSCACVAWMPASALAASPRRFVRLLGLNSSHWPRGIDEDRLIPDHIIPSLKLDPLPVNLADRRDFETIMVTTEREVVLSRARRDSEGRLLGRSSLLAGRSREAYLRRNATPVHAFSETDRLMARPDEFALDLQAKSAKICWQDWGRSDLTPHDGMVRADHPLILQILARTQSSSSLRRLLRNPLGFVWVYAFGWRMPQSSADPLVLDPLGLGDLVHLVLDRALRDLEGAGGLASADPATISATVERATKRVADDWERERPIPPRLIWRRTLEEVNSLASTALGFDEDRSPDDCCYGEVPFGGSNPKSDGAVPWDPTIDVVIPETGFRISGYIDRLDISGDGRNAMVCDYKTGRPPKEDIQLNGGRELQRCLYGFAVKALLGDDVSISASLFYPRENKILRLTDPEATLAEVTRYLVAARTAFAAGSAPPGPDAGGDYDDLAFALPANANAAYCKRKLTATAALLSEVSTLWEAQ